MLRAFLSLICLLSALWLPCEVVAQTSFWLSGDATGRTSQSAPEIEALRSESTEIFLWAQPTTNLENFSLNLVSTSETVLEFDSVVVHNGDTDRFEFVFDSNNGLTVNNGFCDFDGFDFESIPAHAIWDVRGFTLDSNQGTGLATEEGGTLLATISLTGLTLGSADLYLQIGEIGLNELGQSTFETNVVFGDEDDPLLNAELNRCVNSATSDATIQVVDALSRVQILGDFNDDGLVNATDIDLLSTETRAGTHDAFYDVTGDSLVNAADRTFWVEDIKSTVFGDATLDQSVNFDDFLLLSNRFGQAGGWGLGDFDGDAIVGFPDFLVLSAAFGTTLASEHNTVASESVPEPTYSTYWMLALLVAIGSRRRTK